MTRLLCVTLAMFMFVGCGPNDDDEKSSAASISMQPLQGTVAGEPFTVMSGSAKNMFDDGTYWIELSGQESDDPCLSSFGGGPKIIFQIPPEPMDERLSLQNNITFSYGDGENDVATTGQLRVTEFGERVKGGLIATMREHSVDGTFDIPVCPE